MKTTKFLGLPIINSAGIYAVIKNWLSIILFTGLGYFISAMICGSIEGFTWKYIQSEVHYYEIQFYLLLMGVILGHVFRYILYKFGSNFFILRKLDYIFYLIGFILTYLVINELFGL